MRLNVIKAKDKYAKSCGSLDWHDHINGMSARDVELEMEHVCEQVTAEMLDMLKYIVNEVEKGQFLDCEDVFDIKQLIKQATEL